MAVLQHIDELRDRDGIGTDVFGIRSALSKLGVENFLVTRKCFVEGETVIHPDMLPVLNRSDIHILHYGGAGQDFSYFWKLPGKKLLRFHGITPSAFFQNTVSEEIAKSYQMHEERSVFQLYSWKQKFWRVFCDSVSVSESLRDISYTDLHVMPIVRQDWKVGNLVHHVDRTHKIGFIGRIVPNKRIEDLLFLIYFLRKISPRYKLILVGKVIPLFSKYKDYLDSIISRLAIEQNVEFCQEFDESEKIEELRSWDAYCSMSEHEGFGIPILEAFAEGIPVFAFQIPAHKEIMRGAGILFQKKDFLEISLLMESILSNPIHRKKIREQQYDALDYFHCYAYEKEIEENILYAH